MLAKTVSCPVSVVKANSVQGGGTTNCVQRKISILSNKPFGKSICYLSVGL